MSVSILELQFAVVESEHLQVPSSRTTKPALLESKEAWMLLQEPSRAGAFSQHAVAQPSTATSYSAADSMFIGGGGEGGGGGRGEGGGGEGGGGELTVAGLILQMPRECPPPLVASHVQISQWPSGFNSIALQVLPFSL